MKPVSVLPVVFALLVSSDSCLGGEKFLGDWGDRGGSNFYTFRPTGVFEFQRMNRDPAGDNSTAVEGRGERASQERVAGVWSSGKGICSSGLQKGDLMLYVDELQCCMMVQTIAGKIVLNAVFTKGKDDLSLCRNRVLSRREGPPVAGSR